MSRNYRVAVQVVNNKQRSTNESKLNEIYSKNENNFHHLGQNSLQTRNFVKKLRSFQTPTQCSNYSPPSFHDKTIISQQMKHTSVDVQITDYFAFDHLFRKRIGPSVNLDQVNFESSLRAPPYIKQKLITSDLNSTKFSQSSKQSFQPKKTDMSSQLNQNVQRQRQINPIRLGKSIVYSIYEDLEEKNAGVYHKLEKESQGLLNQDTLRWQLQLKNYAKKIDPQIRQQTNSTMFEQKPSRKRGESF